MVEGVAVVVGRMWCDVCDVVCLVWLVMWYRVCGIFMARCWFVWYRGCGIQRWCIEAVV